MSDTKTGDDKTLSVNTKKTLTLKRPGVEQSTVRQNFSHGRTKSVVVETKRKFVKPGEKSEAASVFTPKPAPVSPKPATQEAAKTVPAPERPNLGLSDLSAGEIEARRLRRCDTLNRTCRTDDALALDRRFVVARHVGQRSATTRFLFGAATGFGLGQQSLDAADRIMYSVKRDGRGQIRSAQFAEPSTAGA